MKREQETKVDKRKQDGQKGTVETKREKTGQEEIRIDSRGQERQEGTMSS